MGDCTAQWAASLIHYLSLLNNLGSYPHDRLGKSESAGRSNWPLKRRSAKKQMQRSKSVGEKRKPGAHSSNTERILVASPGRNIGFSVISGWKVEWDCAFEEQQAYMRSSCSSAY